DLFRREPEVYDHSENLFRVVCMYRMLAGLQGIHYNLAKAPKDVLLDTADVFIHGALAGDGGTCASLPVVYAAVGRRLGYPLRLVCAACHYFLRWEESVLERFNIDIAGRGLSTHSDDYYRSWPHVLTPELERADCFLQSMTPRQELAAFLYERGHRWRNLGYDKEAVEGYDKEAVESFLWSLELWPERRSFGGWIITLLEDWGKRLKERLPPKLRAIQVWHPPLRFRAIPEEFERQLNNLSAIEQALADGIWERQLSAPPERPVVFRVHDQPNFERVHE
ncbi:MAG TPA: transglutaminase family protein, partial [Gemmataceae bacterium]|nr:transglutaminase family protein [Gemmataceae bacterium]